MTESLRQKQSHEIQFSGKRAMRWGVGLLLLLALFYLLLPVVGHPPEAYYRVDLNNNLKQVGLGLHNYHDTYGTFPPAYVVGRDGEPLYSWRVLILPFMEENELYEEFHLDEPWTSEHNRSLLEKIPKVYKSPYLPYEEQSSGMTPVRGIVDQHKWRTVLRPQNGIALDEIPDGADKTGIAIGDPAHLIEWTKPEDIDPLAVLVLSDLDQTKLNGIFVLNADGYVQFFDQRNWRELVGLIYFDDGRVTKLEQ